MIAYDSLKQILKDAVKDPDFVRKNTIMQDPVMVAELQNRILAITPDVNIPLQYDSVINQQGALAADANLRQIVFNPAAGFALSLFRDGTVNTPGKIWARVPPGAATPPDGVRYILTDSNRGVQLLDVNLNVVNTFPGFGPVASNYIGGGVYNNPAHAITFTIGGVEYLAIGMGAPNFIVNIYRYSDGLPVGTAGVVGVSGIPPTNLGDITALAFNPTDSSLYIACQTGQPAGATASFGYIAKYTLLGGPLSVLDNLYFVTDGSLLHNEVNAPKALLFDSGSLWVVNGNNEIGAHVVGTHNLSKFIPPNGYDHVLSNVRDIHIKQFSAPTSTATSGSESTQNVFPFKGFVPGETFTGKGNGNADVTGTLQATRASITGAGATYAAVAPGEKLYIEIEGVSGPPQEITATGTENSQSSWLTLLNGGIFGASWVPSGGQVQLRTDRFGGTAGGRILGTSSAAILASLGLSATVLNNPGPNNVGDISLVTAAEFANFLTSTFQASGAIGQNILDVAVTWKSVNTGPNSSVQWTGGTGVAKLLGFDFALHTGAQAGATPAGLKYLYVANAAYGNIVAFDLSTNKVAGIFGIRSQEDNSLSQNNSAFFAAAGTVDGCLPDLITIVQPDGTVQQRNVIIVADASNKRVQRLDEDAYGNVNQVVFQALTFVVPIRLKGWAATGNIPLDMITVEFRSSPVDPWHVLEQVTQTLCMQNLQIRITVSQLGDRATKQAFIKQLTLIAEQA